jgi:hypothetical protein
MILQEMRSFPLHHVTSPLAPGAPSLVPRVDQTVPGDVVPEGVPSKTEAHMDSAPEGASHESLVQLDHPPATVYPDISVDNGLSASGWPQRNAGLQARACEDLTFAH